MNKMKSERAISLIALFVTIIILVIIAVISVSQINDDGLIGMANKAGDRLNERENLADATLQNLKEVFNLGALDHAHDLVLVKTKNATCVLPKYEVYECIYEGCAYYEEISYPGSELGHNYETVSETQPLSCIEPGKKIEECTRCGDDVTQEITSGAHEYNFSGQDYPCQCGGVGAEYYSCELCGDSYMIQWDGPSDHDYSMYAGYVESYGNGVHFYVYNCGICGTGASTSISEACYDNDGNDACDICGDAINHYYEYY